MTTCTLVQSPHILYVGSNGRRICGIRIRGQRSRGEANPPDEWDVSTFTLKIHRETYRKALGLSEEAYEDLLAQCLALKEPTEV